MAYRIEKKDLIVEVNVWGQTSSREVLQIIKELQSKNPLRELPDLWIISELNGVFLDEFPDIVNMLSSLFLPNMVASKTALVATSELVRAQLELYRMDAARLPFETQVFNNREDAVQWLKSSF